MAAPNTRSVALMSREPERSFVVTVGQVALGEKLCACVCGGGGRTIGWDGRAASDDERAAAALSDV